MNTAPVQASSPIAADSSATASSASDTAGDLFSLLLGSLGNALAPSLDGQGASAGEGEALPAAADDPLKRHREGDFSLLFSQLPGADGLGLVAAPPLNASLHLHGEAGLGGPSPGASQLAAVALRTPAALATPAAGALMAAAAERDAPLAFVAPPLLDGAGAEVSSPASLLVATLGDGPELRARGGDSATPPALHAAGAVNAIEELELVLPPGAGPKITQAFADGMAMRVGWMAERQVGHAEIQLHPEDLGSIDVALDFDGMSVRAEFSSSNAEVRQLIETTLPRLRELLEAQGFSLRDANVGTRNDGAGGRDGSPAPGFTKAADGSAGEAGLAAEPAPRRAVSHRGGLSEYA